MSRMVRENQASGLRERLFFAQWSLRDLRRRQQDNAPRGELLAQRAAVIFHLYSAVVGLARQALNSQPSHSATHLISLAEVEKAALGLQLPELILISEARNDSSDMLFWLRSEERRVG